MKAPATTSSALPCHSRPRSTTPKSFRWYYHKSGRKGAPVSQRHAAISNLLSLAVEHCCPLPPAVSVAHDCIRVMRRITSWVAKKAFNGSVDSRQSRVACGATVFAAMNSLSLHLPPCEAGNCSYNKVIALKRVVMPKLIRHVHYSSRDRFGLAASLYDVVVVQYRKSVASGTHSTKGFLAVLTVGIQWALSSVVAVRHCRDADEKMTMTTTRPWTSSKTDPRPIPRVCPCSCAAKQARKPALE